MPKKFYSVEKGVVKEKPPLFYLLIITGFVILCYINTLYNDFVWDDRYLVLKNPFIRQLNLKKIFFQDLYYTNFTESVFFRPLQNLSYFLDYKLWGHKPYGYHFTNILLHLLSAIGIFFLVNIIVENTRISLFTSLLFATHPVHYAAVTYISGRGDLLFLLFFIASFLGFIQYLKTKKSPLFLISIIFFIMSLLSKEMALVSVFIFFLYDLFLAKENKSFKERVKLYLPYIVIIISYAVFRIRHLPDAMLKSLLNIRPLEGVFIFPRISGYYIKILLFPSKGYMRRGLNALSGFENNVIPYILFALGVLLLYFSRNRHKPIFFFTLYFFITISAVSNIFLNLNTAFADHWLYMGSIAFFFVVSYILIEFFHVKTKDISYCIIWILAGFFSLITIQQNSYWRDNISLFSEIVKRNPDDILARTNLGMSYAEKKDYKKAIKILTEILNNHPNYIDAYYNLGIVYFNMKKYDKAYRYFKKAVGLEDNFAEPYLYIGLLYKIKDDRDVAERQFLKFIKLKPYSKEGYLQVGILKYEDKKYDLAKKYFIQAIGNDPYDPTAILYLATILRREGKFNKAFALLERGVKTNPTNVELLMDLGNLYTSFGLFDKALLLYKKAVLFDPHRPVLYYNISELYRLRGKMDKSERFRNYVLRKKR